MQLHAQLSENHSPIIIRIITIILIACTPCKCVYICILYIQRERESSPNSCINATGINGLDSWSGACGVYGSMAMQISHDII